MALRRWLLLGFALHLALFAGMLQARSTFAEEIGTPDDIRELLSKGLTIYEIDQELIRLTAMEEQLAIQIADVTVQAAEQEVVVAAKREQASKVLRSYYKGKRNHLWLFIIKADSFYEGLQTYHYLSRIFKHEQRLLQDHADHYKTLKNLLLQLEEDRNQLQAVKAEFIAQRARLIELEEQLNRELAMRDDAEQIQEQIDELTHQWETKGLPVFKHYFNELARTINKLPEEIIASGNLKLQNGRFVMSISDEELTDFFRRHNPEDFEHFTFSFAEGDFAAYGARDDTAISISGYYDLMTDENIIAFHLTKLIYNGYELPDTTIRALNEQFDLNFYPDNLDMPFRVQAQSVDIEDGRLSISFVLRR